ncbi:MAG: ABC transporter permease [Actinomycetota bacterium]
MIAAVAWLAVVVLGALAADLMPLSPRDADACQPSCLNVPPGHRISEILGTDNYGRSILTRVVYGARVSVTAGLASVAIALTLGMLVGVSAGYFRRRFDTVVGVGLDALLSFPPLILLLALAATMGPGLRTVVIGLSLISFPSFARLARATTLRYRSSEFVLASRGLGARARTVLVREIVPVVIGPMLAYAGTVTGVLILTEASLSFLGLGVPPPQPSWGNMIFDGKSELSTHPHVVFVPAAVLFLTIFALHVVGEHFRGRNAKAGKL